MSIGVVGIRVHRPDFSIMFTGFASVMLTGLASVMLTGLASVAL